MLQLVSLSKTFCDLLFRNCIKRDHSVFTEHILHGKIDNSFFCSLSAGARNGILATGIVTVGFYSIYSNAQVFVLLWIACGALFHTSNFVSVCFLPFWTACFSALLHPFHRGTVFVDCYHWYVLVYACDSQFIIIIALSCIVTGEYWIVTRFSALHQTWWIHCVL